VLVEKVREVGIVLRVGDDVVDVVIAALEWLPRLELPGGEIEAMDGGKPVVVRPHPAVHP